MKTVTAKLPPELMTWLSKEAQTRRTSKSKIIRESLALVRNMTGKRQRLTFAEAAGDLFGCFDGPGDLSHNPKHMKNYGR